MSGFWQTILSSLGFVPSTKVGFLCSVSNAQNQMGDYLQAFKNGLNNAGVVIPKFAKYKRGDLGELESKADDLITNQKVKVLVAAGGFVSLQAAVNVVNKPPRPQLPILYIIGRPAADFGIADPNISGGINLDIPRYNVDRVNALKAAPYRATKVGLLFNYNATMGQNEADDWDQTNWGPIQRCGYGIPNEQINLGQEVSALRAQLADAIVVASDPYFTNQRADLVAALNYQGIPFCYPFDSYWKAGADPNLSFRFGPDLENEYKELGKLAKAVISQLPGTPIPNVGVRTSTNRKNR